MSEWSSGARLTVWAWLAALAACVSLAPLMQGRGFLLAGAVVGAAVAAVGAAGRRYRLPPVLVLVLQVFVLLEWATVSYAADEAWAYVVPTRDSMLALVDVGRSAVALAQEYRPPAPQDRALTASMAAIVSGVVVVVDLVAVAWRRPALVGLAFLAIYMAPVALLAGDVPVLAFVPGAVAYVFLLGAEQRERVAHWGRQISVSASRLGGGERSDGGLVRVSPLVRSGRRVGLGAVALAVVVPVVVPTFPRTLLADGPLTPGDGSGGDGDGVVQVDNPMLDLRRNLGERTTATLVTVRTNDETPTYLRIAALDQFTGSSWVPGPREAEQQTSLDRVAVPPGLTTQTTRETARYQITLSDRFETSWLPTFYALRGADAPGPWGADPDELDISSLDEDVTGAGLSYSVDALLVSPSADDLTDTGPPGESLSRYLELSPEAPAIIGDLARQVTADAGTRFDAALALQDWFRRDGGFMYSLEAAEGDGLATIEAFLSEERTGYCEQFAAAMALMARELGIPARVAVGFLSPQQVSEQTYAFRGVDMHAWPELYFEGVGWVRFEPTPAQRTGAAPQFGANRPEQTTTTEPTRTLPTPTSAAPTTPPDAGASQAGGGGGGGVGRGLLLTLTGLVLTAALVSAPRAARTGVRLRRWRRAGTAGAPAVPEVAWRELGDQVLDLGVRIEHGDTVRATGRGLRSLLDDDPAAVAALNRLVIDVERARFARRGRYPDGARERAEQDVAAVVRRVAAGRSAPQRWRSRWLPVSLLARRRPAGSPRSGPRWRAGGRAHPDTLVLQADERPPG